MDELMRLVDYNVKEERDLPVSWLSAHGVDIKIAGAYQLQCKKEGKPSSQKRVAELLGNNIVHLRQHTLENGLRYVTIHQADGTEIFDDSQYDGLTSCSCGAIHDMPAITSATYALRDKPKLGDGFRLIGTSAYGNPDRNGAIYSYVEKEFTAGKKKVKVDYSLRPDYAGDGGSLSFRFEINTPGTVTYQVKNMTKGGRIEDRTEKIISKHVKIEIISPRHKQGEASVIGRSSILVAYNLPEYSWRGEFDQIEFKFDNDSRLEEVVGISQTAKPNPELTDEQVLIAIKKGRNDWFRYDPKSLGASILTHAVFGTDFFFLRHNTRRTLNALVEAAIKESDIDLAKAVAFV